MCLSREAYATSVGYQGDSWVFFLLCFQIQAGAGGLCHRAGSFVAFREFALIAAGF